MSWEALKKLWKHWGTKGLNVPHAHDPATNAPSVRLLMAALAFLVALASVVVLHFAEGLLTATWTAISFYVVCMVLYMLRTLSRAKVDLDDRSLELDSGASGTDSERQS